MRKDDYYIDLLTNWLRDHEDFVGNQRVAACVVFKNIVAFGHNKDKTSPFQEFHNPEDYDVSTHAETDAIKNAVKRIPKNKMHKATIYVARVKKDGSTGMAKPCMKGCSQAIQAYGIGRVVYTTEDGYSVYKSR